MQHTCWKRYLNHFLGKRSRHGWHLTLVRLGGGQYRLNQKFLRRAHTHTHIHILSSVRFTWFDSCVHKPLGRSSVQVKMPIKPVSAQEAMQKQCFCARSTGCAVYKKSQSACNAILWHYTQVLGLVNKDKSNLISAVFISLYLNVLFAVWFEGHEKVSIRVLSVPIIVQFQF